MVAPTYNPWRPEVRVDPYPTYRALRSAEPVHFHPHARIWFLTRHADCVAFLRDGRFSARLGHDLRTRSDALPASMLTADPPEHARLREPVRRLFTPGALAPVQRRLRAIVRELLDRLAAAGGGDLIAGLAAPLALRIMAELIGVPERDVERFRACTLAASSNLDPLATPEAQARATAAAHELDRCVLAVAGAASPGEAGLVGRALRRELRRGTLDPEELVTLGSLMVIGGYEPIVHLIGNGMLALLRDPAQLERLRAGGDERLERSAIEELLRYDSPIQFAARGATADVELGGATIARGEGVVALLGAANRDPEEFADPDRLDLGRHPNPHLGFGGGAHACAGAPVARLAARVAIGELVRRFGELELAGPPRWRDSHVPRGLSSLPVRL